MNTSPADKAVELFNEGCHCATSILLAFHEQIKLDPATAVRITSGFGGGISHSGELCGAVSGAAMVLGMAHGSINPLDRDTRHQVYDKVNELRNRFTEQHGSCQCCELLGYHLGRQDEYDKVKELGLFDTECPKFVRRAAELLETML